MLFFVEAITKIMRLIKCRCRCSVLLLPLFLRSCSCTSIRFICTTMLIGCCHLAILILSMSVVCQPFSPFSPSKIPVDDPASSLSLSRSLAHPCSLMPPRWPVSVSVARLPSYSSPCSSALDLAKSPAFTNLLTNASPSSLTRSSVAR